MKRLIIVPAAVILTIVALPGADRERNARDLYYSNATSGKDDSSEWLGVRTGILFREKDSKGLLRFSEVSDLKTFRDGDQFRFRVQANTDGYVYLFLRDSAGDTQLLFPYEKGTDNKVHRYRTRQVPEKDWFRFDKESGKEQVFLILSPSRIREFDSLTGDDREVTNRELKRIVERGAGESKIFDEENLEDGGDIGATYFVEKPAGGRDYLVRRFDLVHKKASK